MLVTMTKTPLRSTPRVYTRSGSKRFAIPTSS